MAVLVPCLGIVWAVFLGAVTAAGLLLLTSTGATQGLHYDAGMLCKRYGSGCRYTRNVSEGDMPFDGTMFGTGVGNGAGVIAFIVACAVIV